MAQHYQHISRKGKPGGYAGLDDDGKVPAAQLPEGGGGGEANTASNVGSAGTGVFKQKTGVDLELKKLNAGSARLTITDNTGESRIDLDVPSGAFETAGAVAAHEAAGDPHAQYTTAAEAAAAVAAAVVAHEAASDPHAQYQRESEKDAANGYAGLDATTKVPGQQQTYGAISNTAAEGNDARLSDARTPTAHAASHQNGGGDELNIGGLSGVLADPQPPIIGAAGTQAVAGNDARLADARTPTAHTHAPADVTGTAVVTADARLSDARTPLAHAHPQSDVTGLVTDLAAKAPLASPAFTGTPTGITKAHVGLGSVDNTADTAKPVSTAQQTALDGKAAVLGADDNYVTDAEKVKLGNLSGTNTGDQTLPTDATIATTDITTNDASAAKHGWLPKLPGGTTTFLRSDGAFAAPTAAAADLDCPETGSLTVATGKYHLTGKRHQCTGSQRISVAGSGRLRILN